MLKRILTLLFLFVLSFSIFVLVEDSTYDEIKIDTVMKEERKALVMTWKTHDQSTFWTDYEISVHPKIEELYDQKLIEQALPFHHKALAYKNYEHDWTNCIVLMLSEEVDQSFYLSVDSIIKKSALADNFCALDFNENSERARYVLSSKKWYL